MSKILLVEDDIQQAILVSETLAKYYDVQTANNLKEAREKLKKNQLLINKRTQFDLVIVDRDLPDGDGLDLVAELHTDFYFLPVLILSGFAKTESRIEGLKEGADDYLTKPFVIDELILRINSLLEKEKILPKNKIIKKNGVEYFPALQMVKIMDQEFKLSKQGDKIWSVLFRHQGQVLSREDFVVAIWQRYGGKKIDIRTVDVGIRRLRESLGEWGRKNLISVHGVGYKLLVNKSTQTFKSMLKSL